MQTSAALNTVVPLASATSNPDVPATIAEWRLETLLGSGSTALVYAAKPVMAARNVPALHAVKLLRAELASQDSWVRQFRREGVLGQRIVHPHLIPVLGGGLREAPFHLVLPRLFGATAAKVLENPGVFACGQAVWVVRQVSEALAAVHSQGWLHGDVKPANIHLTAEGHATLFDFGFATPLEDAAEPHQRRLAGTLAYCAPEQFTSRYRIGPASDIYSLGITFFQLLTGQLPFNATRPAEWVEAHLQAVPPSPRSFASHVPREVAGCVNRMLAKEPSRRPTTDGELQDLLLGLELRTFTMRGAQAA